jgi:hypothetical protein
LSRIQLTLRSAHYAASWLEDPAAFRRGMAAIHDGAASLIDAIEEHLLAADEVDLAA